MNWVLGSVRTQGAPGNDGFFFWEHPQHEDPSCKGINGRTSLGMGSLLQEWSKAL